MTEQPSGASSRVQKAGALTLAVGAVCAACLTTFTGDHEGEKRTAYRDVGGVETICYGDTANVRAGQTATHTECIQRLDAQLSAKAGAVLQCTPGLRAHPYTLAAAIDFAYNVGTRAYCGSTVARRFAAGDLRGGCDGMLAWVYVKGVRVQGLANRRADERTLCLRGLAS